MLQKIVPMPLKKRNWKIFPKLLKENSLSTYSFLGTFGSIVTIVTYYSKDSPLIDFIFWSGICILSISILIFIFKSIPPELISLDNYHDGRIPLNILDKIYPTPFVIGIIGCSKSGKTTFLKNSEFSKNPLSRTNEVYAKKVQVPNSKGNIVVLDGDGKEFTQQFYIMEKINILIIFFDHNETDNSSTIMKTRLTDHEYFFDQVISHLKNQKDIKHIHLIMNKNDLWKKAKSISNLEEWFEIQKNKLKNNSNYNLTDSLYYSNNIPENIGEIFQVICDAREKFHEK